MFYNWSIWFNENNEISKIIKNLNYINVFTINIFLKIIFANLIFLIFQKKNYIRLKIFLFPVLKNKIRTFLIIHLGRASFNKLNTYKNKKLITAKIISFNRFS